MSIEDKSKKIKKVNVNGIEMLFSSAIDSNITPTNIRAGVTILGVEGNLEPDKPDQSKTVTPTTSTQTITADAGYELASVTINPVTRNIDNNIQAENIKKDVTILGVVGTLESGSLPEYMSAKNFTFDGNACTGYVGDTSVPQIIIPKSYSYTITPKHLAGSYVNISEIRNRTNNYVTNITLCNEDGSNVHSYASTSELRNNFGSHFGNETKVLIQRLTHRASNTLSLNQVKTYVRDILSTPVYYNNEVYDDVSKFISKYVTTSTKDLTLFGGTIEEITFFDGEDVTVTSINGTGSSSGFSSYKGDIIVPPSITNFGSYTFRDCQNNRILIDKITSIGNYAFYGCSGIDKLSLNYTSSISDFAFYKTNIDNLYIPSNISTIPQYAFGYCPLKSLVFENGINKIITNAFYSCRSLTSITIPESLVNVSGGAFGNCNLDSISVDINNSTFYVQDNCLINKDTKELTIGTNSSIISNDVTRIGNSAFSGRELLTITIPNSVTSIGNSAFKNCSGLTSIIIPNSVTSIGDDAFHSCSGLISVDLGNGVESIGQFVFDRCTGLTSITIPDSVTSIGGYAFEYCSGLTSVAIGNGITSIGYGVFSNCSSLTEMTIKATTPPTLESKNAISTATTTIYIPAGTLESYQTATNWSNFADKFVELSA